MAITLFSKHLYAGPRADIRRRLALCLGQISEWFWFCLSFMLFIVLGPFSAPVALIVLVRLGMEEHICEEPKSITTL